MTLKEVSELTGIPYQTLLGWNSSKGDYRKSLVRFLKDADRSVLIKYFGYKEGANNKPSLRDGDV
nr:MAG TPA: helix-turn-helix domain protein [Caudoviricetes sp.]DAU94207.1 MAG TPA: helix-turn-helix domain protein [Caudoviricetes sp.]